MPYILTSMFAQVSADEEYIIVHLESNLSCSGLERKEGNIELKMTFWVAESSLVLLQGAKFPILFINRSCYSKNVLFPP